METIFRMSEHMEVWMYNVIELSLTGSVLSELSCSWSYMYSVIPL